MILAVGYRVRSPRGTQFRQWATAHLEEYLVKGFIMDDQRLKEPGGWDYFDELLAKGRQDLTLDYWRNNVDRLLEFNERPVLQGAGAMSAEQAKLIAFETSSLIPREGKMKRWRRMPRI